MFQTFRCYYNIAMANFYRKISVFFDKLQVLSNKNFESVSNSMLTLVDCKSTESKSSIDFY